MVTTSKGIEAAGLCRLMELSLRDGLQFTSALDAGSIQVTSLEETSSRKRSNLLKRAEWILGVILSATVLFLLMVRGTHAGALWRDECAAVQLARMPSFADISRNFQHEAFPLLFPTMVRGYTGIFGTSDGALRCFGTGAGVVLICALWFSSRLIGRGVPLLSLALIGLNTTFLVWGTTLRGYGLGSALIILTFGLVSKVLVEPSPARIAAAALVSLASVQCLLHNLVLMCALAGSAAAVCLVRRNPKQVIVFVGLLALCMISFVPYMGAYSSGSAWSLVVEFPVTFRLLWKQFTFALGNPTRELAWLWHIAFVILLAVSIWRLYRVRSSKPAPEWDFLLFGVLVAIAATIGYYEFLQLLSYLARSWYYLALLSLLAVTLDFVAATLTSLLWVRIGRLLFAAIALVVLPFNAWPKVLERQTNIDIVSKKVADLAKPTDLIVVAPWQYGISFNRYYHGATPWITLPMIADLRVHRYDLMFEKMTSPHPIDDVLEMVSQALASGNRVWFVGGIKLPPPGKQPLSLSPAPSDAFGFDNTAYTESWLEQLGAFVRTHSEHGQTVLLPSTAAVNDFENVPLFAVDGWQ